MATSVIAPANTPDQTSRKEHVSKADMLLKFAALADDLETQLAIGRQALRHLEDARLSRSGAKT